MPLHPRGPTALDLGEGTADDFEQVCFLVVQIEFPDIVRIKRPDGGIEFGLPGGDGEFVRCWQAKRYTGGISWGKCEESLDAAVTNWAMAHYTFCFAYDLTVGQHKTFQKRLASRHKGTRVDYWNHSKLASALLATKQGARILNHFYADRADNMDRFMQAVRSGGALESGTDVSDRLDAIAEFLALNDPYYRYTTVTLEAGTPGPSLTPSTIISVAFEDGALMKRIDAVPRHPHALPSLPEGDLYFEDTPDGREQLQKLERFLRHGGELELEGMRFEMRNLPRLFQDIDAGSGLTGTILLSAPKAPIPPWAAQFVTDTDLGHVEVDVDLREIDPPEGWDAALGGTVQGGLTIQVVFRDGDPPEMKTQWSYSYAPTADARFQAHVLSFIEAMHGVGTVTVRDRDGVRPVISEKLTGRELENDRRVWTRFMKGLAAIEDWTGKTFKLPADIAVEDVRAVIHAADVIEAGEASMTWERTELVMPIEKYESIFGAKDEHQIGIGHTFGIEIFGEFVEIGELRGTVAQGFDIETAPVIEDGEEAIQVVLTPSSAEARHPVFALFPPGTEFTLYRPEPESASSE